MIYLNELQYIAYYRYLVVFNFNKLIRNRHSHQNQIKFHLINFDRHTFILYIIITVQSMKRSKNIFNSPVAPQSLLDEEGNRQFQVGGLSISSNWLTNIQPSQYRKYILSALHLSQLQRELNDLREENHKYQSGNMKQSNLFKIGNVKKKIDNFVLVETQQQGKHLQAQQSLMKNEPPATQKLRVHKVAGFFNSIIQRKCKIQEKQLYFQTQKDNKTPWLALGIEKYVIQRQSKEQSLADKKQELKHFAWPQNQKSRLLLEGKQLRPYCIYGDQQELKKFQRYFQVQNIQKKQLGVFGKLNLQFQQKIITLFGNKVRFYDHNLRQRKAEKDVHFSTITKNDLAQRKRQETAIKPIKQMSSQLGHSSEVGKSSELGQSGLLDRNYNNINSSNINTSSQIILDGLAKTPQKGHQPKAKGGSQIFKLKVKSSVVFYDEIEEPIHFEDQANYSIADLKLNLKEQIGISDIDEQSLNKSQISIRKQKLGKKIVHMSLQNVLDQSERFNINIHEASSMKPQGGSQILEKSLSRQGRSLSQKNSLSLSNINDPAKQKNRKNSQDDSLLDEFKFDKQRPNVEDNLESQSGQRTSEKQNKKTARDFKKKKEGQIQIFQNLRPHNTYFSIQQIQMLAPYHKDTLDFQLIQIDPNLQMQRKIVVCARAVASFKEQKGTLERYTLYSTEGGFHFKVSRDSDQFIFVLKQESKHHYLRFDVNPSPKYQRNCSQLLLSKLDKQGYPFACGLIMFSSPTPIELKQPLTTVQFLHKYLNQGEKYDFKQDFIDDKKKRYLIKRQWNKYVLKNTVRVGDADSFARSIFLGMSDSIFNKLKKDLDYDPKKLFNFSDNELRMLEQNISSAGIMDLRSFMKPSSLIKHISQANCNQMLRERLQQVYVYFLKRYGSTRNLALIFIKEVLNKIEAIILMAKREEDVFAIVDLYFDVEYQIDELFLQISKYFQK